MVNRRKTDTIAEKRQRKRRGYSLSIEDDGYNDNEVSGLNPDQEDGLYNLEDDWNWRIFRKLCQYHNLRSSSTTWLWH